MTDPFVLSCICLIVFMVCAFCIEWFKHRWKMHKWDVCHRRVMDEMKEWSNAEPPE